MLVIMIALVLGSGAYLLMKAIQIFLFLTKRLGQPWKDEWVSGGSYIVAQIAITAFVTLGLCILFADYYERGEALPQLIICCFQLGIFVWIILSTRKNYKKYYE